MIVSVSSNSLVLKHRPAGPRARPPCNFLVYFASAVACLSLYRFSSVCIFIVFFLSWYLGTCKMHCISSGRVLFLLLYECFLL
ncbi:hypothetical protein I7I50_11161 [Histoplasma capsulatum G186AR]|uniref:Uncharacterized protein n=1 Tax=Ajellomyces capsulatus TaxID=5037 RepID=A0A8H8D7Z5_AJECA|nr:hypothetical protein I7I52_02399 [Histoplasma capsulatum]QSS69756.1 hypothetical protein I7I50_11161 [Histoplasma capsulatum G186AR]